jgi:tight adherence protein C
MPEAARPAFAAVGQRVATGERFADALGVLPALLGPRAHALADAFAAADRDGLPLAPVLVRLASEARHDRRRRADARARQLPVRLAFPLVLCTLPSFVLLAVAPLLLAALHTIRR